MAPDNRLAAALATVALYLLFCLFIAFIHRRRQRRLHAMAAALQPSASGNANADAVLVAYASQTGFAEQIAFRTARALQDSGVPVALSTLGSLSREMLQAARHALFVVSTTGEGDAPDSAARFTRQLMVGDASLSGLSYGLLALGDRSYHQFCAFGHRLDHWLRHNHAAPMFDLIEVNNADDGALRHWQASLRTLGADANMPDWTPAAYAPWRLVERRLLNPGSIGGPVYLVALTPPASGAEWQAGDIAEIGPRDPLADDGEAQPHREYSIASIPADGRIELIVRQMRHPDGRLGLGSGWLTEHAPLGAEIDLRIRSNTAFHGPEDDRPMILIGNGTGLAGLRGHLKAREASGHNRNWLIFGERSAAHDYLLGDELDRWRANGLVKRLDLAFSRDQAERVYVQHRLAAAESDLRDWLRRDAAIYVCGSLEGMAGGVHAALETILGAEALEDLLENGRYRRDVY